ncbi:tRNA1(Val) (adenine(37)-N6)-methyltransferase [Fulvivirga ligni]|uniref:tRNA1(Val) (adenine(37)-N6)-methyltransferase n=1 Tax=Fulvivirga ligni TaxID=2904246 RepID=UPI001F462164|nr:methyltransferase [Fulvivirga ligni]UII20324.1 methyltransferase [Fulvivirga ligni]
MRRKHQFDFKEFSVTQEKSAMKVGTDGVLLGAWAQVTDAQHILDIGTGTGVIALMMAQRSTKSYIQAIDISEEAVTEANHNFNHSPWGDRLEATNIYLQEFIENQPKGKYDLVVSNPPFFQQGSTEAAGKDRHQARHNSTLSQADLLKAVDHLLSEHGLFSVILPYLEGLAFIKMAQEFSLHLHRQTAFFSKIEKPQERWLLEFGRKEQEILTTELVHYNSENGWTDDYRALTKAFYTRLK